MGDTRSIMPPMKNDLFSKSNLPQVIIIGLMLFSFFMSALISRTVFERLPHLEDEVAYLFQARIFARGHIVADIEDPVNAYWQPFVISQQDTGNRFSKYTPGWSAVLAIGERMGQTWVINAFFSALTVAVVYRLGREVYTVDVGLIASALVAFSPMALLLNASLMSHTSALFFFTMFMYAYWRLSQDRHRLEWGTIAGVMLGLLVINRPITAIGIVVPFVIISVLRLAVVLYHDSNESNSNISSNIDPVGHGLRLSPESNPKPTRQFLPTLAPLVVLGIITLIFSSAIPIYNHVTTDDASLNLYTLVWEYDQIGFGTCCGRSSVREPFDGHSILKGIRHARFDLSLMGADIFGWALGRTNDGIGWEVGQITDEVQEHLRTASDYFPLIGISWLLLPIGLLMGLRKEWMKIWAIAGILWFILPFALNMDFLKESNAQIWRWLIIGTFWVLALPVAIITDHKRDPKSLWTWLFIAVALSLIGVHLAYWIGSQRYSTRYYFEALSAIALLSALPLAWLARHYGRLLVYTGLAGIMLFSLYQYSTPRIMALHQFNFVSNEQVDAIRERALTDDPILVIATDAQGTDTITRWRSYGSLMVVTSPFLDSEIVVARDFRPASSVREQILARFPDRQVVDIYVNGNDWWFPEENSP